MTSSLTDKLQKIFNMHAHTFVYTQFLIYALSFKAADQKLIT